MGRCAPAGVCLITGMAVLLGACGGSQGGVNELPAGASEIEETAGGAHELEKSADETIAASADGFTLAVSPDTFLTTGSVADFTIVTESQCISSNDSATYNNDNAAFFGNSAALSNSSEALSSGNSPTACSRAAEKAEIVVTISARDAVDLRALYCDLTYDPARYTPVSVEHLAWLAAGEIANGAPPASGADQDMLTLVVLCEPGVVHIGQVLAHWDKRAGLSGDAELARVRFAPEPFEQRVKQASATLDSPELAVHLRVDNSRRNLFWWYRLPGDYNQDGLVGISDLTPIGANLGKLGRVIGHTFSLDNLPIYSFEPNEACGVIDGNGDGLISIHDITPIGSNFNQQIDGYRVYASTDIDADYSPSVATAPEIDHIAELPVSMLSGDARYVRRFYNTPFPMLQDGWYYWVRPYHGEAAGKPSSYGMYKPDLPAQFSVSLQPETFLGNGVLDDVKFDVCEFSDQVVLDLWIEGAEGLQAFSSWVEFNPDDYAPVDVFAAATALPGSVVNLDKPTTAAALIGKWLVCMPIKLGGAGGYSGTWNICRLVLNRTRQESTTGFYPDTSQYQYTPAQYDEGTKMYSWWYRSNGDLDQDGFVLSDDFIMISFYLNEAADSLSNGWVLDANSDGVVDISDMTNIGQSYGNAVDGFNIYASIQQADIPSRVSRYDLDLLEAPDHLLIGHVDLSDLTGDPLKEQLKLDFTVADPEPGMYFWLMPTFQGQVGNVIEYSIVQIPLPPE